jgi:Xaa-Pro aminopeptidase
MELSILRGRLDRAADAMRRHDIDMWITLGRESHILGEPALLYLMPGDLYFRTAVLVTRGGERVCVCAPIESEEIEASGLFTGAVTYSGQSGFEAALTGALKDRMPAGRIALNFSALDPSSDGLSHSDFLLLQRCFEAAGFTGDIVSSEPVMKCVRGKKSDAEAEKIACAVRLAMSVYEEARPRMRLGMSGEDVQRLFQGIIDGHGWGYSWEKRNNPYVSVGARSSYMCRHPPADVFIEPGDVVNVDLGIRADGFASDNQRTFWAPRPGESASPEEVQRAFETLQRMNREVCAAMKTGVDSASLTAIGDCIMRECGYPQGWGGGYGHEIGLFAHNGGIAAGNSAMKAGLDTVLEENMTFTLEPAILTSYGRVCQEEVVRVTKEGGVMLSAPQEEIWTISE